MKDLDSFIEQMRELFVTKEVFELRMAPIEKLFYGIISLVVLGVFSALVALVIKI